MIMSTSRKESDSRRCSLGFVKLQDLKEIQNDENTATSLICRLKNSVLVSIHHPRTFYFYKSFPVILYERYRQVNEGASYVINPFSLFGYIWDSIMIFINVAHMLLCPFRHCYLLGNGSLHWTDHIIFTLNLVCLVDLVLRFRMGYVHDMVVVLSKRKIAKHYLKTWFFPDLLSSLPVAYFCLVFGVTNRKLLLAAHLPAYLRLARIFTVIPSVDLLLRSVTHSYLVLRLVRYLVLFVLIMHWMSCCVYFIVVCKFYVSNVLNKGYDIYVTDEFKNLLDLSIADRYIRALFICVAAFLGCGYVLFSVSDPDEIMMNTLITFIVSIFMIYTIVFVLKLYLVMYNSKLRYHELINQVEIYISHKQFPASLKKRILLFYKYRYWGDYYNSEDAFSCLSEQLRYEIKFHTCQILVEKVPIFKELPPAVVGSILGSLKPEVYLTGDLIVKVGDIGDCMYFIAKGTVAVYSWKGAEVAHLEDGAHFGEVALLMKDNKRMVSVVSMEITHVYKLDVADFRRFVLTNEVLLNRIETLSARRMHETVLLDEQFRKQSNSNEDFDTEKKNEPLSPPSSPTAKVNNETSYL